MSDLNRRKFVTMLSTGAAVIPLAALVTSLPSRAADLPVAVDPESAAAKTYNYVAVSEKPEDICGGCALYSGDEGAELGLCPLFAGSSVMASGWCSAYVAKS